MDNTTYTQALKIIDQLSLAEQHLLLEHLQRNLDDDWALSGDQLAFMMERHNAIMSADERDDDAFFHALEDSKEYKALFGDMCWDEAFDRYEEAMQITSNE